MQNAELINSIARGIGLHDFYQPGLWSYCEGYDNEGVTFCSTPKAYYWFNIVQIILDELLSGATIALPSTLTEILNILQICSHIMFAFFLAGTILAFVMVFLSPLAMFSRWVSLPMAFLSSATFFLIFAGSVIASVISFVFKYAATAQSTLNIKASVGIKMFVFMWIATGFAFIGFVLHAGMGCCCTSRRDLKTGKKPMRHSSMKRAMSQRSVRTNMSQTSGARDVFIVAGGPAGRSRSNSAFSFEQQPSGSRGRSGTLLSANNLGQISEKPDDVTEPAGVHSRTGSLVGSSNGVSRSNTMHSTTNSGQVSRANTVKGDVSRSNTLKSTTGGGGGRTRSNTLRSIRFEDERPPSFSNESDTTAVDTPDGSRAAQPLPKAANWPLPEKN